MSGPEWAPSLLIAHRGASATFPEHSPSALLEAIRQGADGVEMDLRLSADHRLLLHHDPSFRRCCGSSRLVREVHSRERLALNCCHRHPHLPAEPVLLLEEALDLLPLDRWLFLELKEGPEQAQALHRTLGAARKRALCVISFRLETLLAVGHQLPGVPRLWLRAGRAPVQARTLRTWRSQCQRYGLQGLNVQASAVDLHLGQALREGGLDGGAWTVDQPGEARRVQELGLRWITTNVPAALRQALKCAQAARASARP